MLVHKAEGLLLRALAEKFGFEVDSEIFWDLAFIYGGTSAAVYWMPAGALWSMIGFQSVARMEPFDGASSQACRP